MLCYAVGMYDGLYCTSELAWLLGYSIFIAKTTTTTTTTATAERAATAAAVASIATNADVEVCKRGLGIAELDTLSPSITLSLSHCLTVSCPRLLLSFSYGRCCVYHRIEICFWKFCPVNRVRQIYLLVFACSLPSSAYKTKIDYLGYSNRRHRAHRLHRRSRALGIVRLGIEGVATWGSISFAIYIYIYKACYM